MLEFDVLIGLQRKASLGLVPVRTPFLMVAFSRN